MPDPIDLSPEMSQKIDELLDQMTQNADASDDLRREIRSHLEDRAIAYLGGEQRLSEAEVLLLIKSHFGDVRQLHGLFHGLPIMKRAKALAQEAFTWVFYLRLASVIVAACAASFVAQAADQLWLLLIPANPQRGDGKVFYSLLVLATPALFSLVVILLLNIWDRRAECAWFLRIAPRRVIMIVAGILAIRWLIPGTNLNRTVPATIWGDIEVVQVMVSRLLIQLPSAIWVLAWLMRKADGIPVNWTTRLDRYAAALIGLCVTGYTGPLWTFAGPEAHGLIFSVSRPRFGASLLYLPDQIATLCLMIVASYLLLRIVFVGAATRNSRLASA